MHGCVHNVMCAERVGNVLVRWSIYVPGSTYVPGSAVGSAGAAWASWTTCSCSLTNTHTVPCARLEIETAGRLFSTHAVPVRMRAMRMSFPYHLCMLCDLDYERHLITSLVYLMIQISKIIKEIEVNMVYDSDRVCFLQ